MICGIGVLCVIGIPTFGVLVLTGRTLRDSGTIAFAIFLVAFFASFVFSLLIGRGKRGAILLDCGPQPRRVFFLLNAAIFAIGFLILTLGIADGVVRITISMFSILLWFGRLQFVENGIWQYWSLLKWQDLESYEWQGDATHNLILQTKTKLTLLGREFLSVPVEKKNAVSKLLEQYATQKDA